MTEFRENIWSTKRSSVDPIPQLWDNDDSNKPLPQFRQQNFVPRRHSYLGAGVGSEIDSKMTLNLINDYFTKDPHNRIKVTLDLLDQRFFDEEKYLSDSYQLPKFPIENSLRNYQLVLVGFKAGRIDVFYLPLDNQLLIGLQVGDLVIVEADRGRDLGKIFKMNISIDEARLLKLLQFQEQQSALSETMGTQNDELSVKQMGENSLSTSPNSNLHNSGSGSAGTPPPTLHFPKPILSLAQPNEILQILNKNQDEEKACRLCLAKIASATGFPNISSPTSSPTSSNINTDLLQMKLIDAEYQFDRKKLIFYYSTSKRIDFRDLVRELFRIYKTRIWMCAVTGLPYVPNSSSGNTKKSFPNISFNSNGQTVPNGNFSTVVGSANNNYSPTRFSIPTYQAGGPPLQQQVPMNMYPNLNNDMVQVPRRFMNEAYYTNIQQSPQSTPQGPDQVQKPIFQNLLMGFPLPQMNYQQQCSLPDNSYRQFNNDMSQGNQGNPQQIFQQFHQMLNTNSGYNQQQPNNSTRSEQGNEMYKNLDNSTSTISLESYVLKSLVDSINH